MGPNNDSDANNDNEDSGGDYYEYPNEDGTTTYVEIGIIEHVIDTTDEE